MLLLEDTIKMAITENENSKNNWKMEFLVGDNWKDSEDIYIPWPHWRGG